MISEKNLEVIFVVFLIILGFFFIYLAFNTQMLGEDEAYYYFMAKDFSNETFLTHDSHGIPIYSVYLTSLLCSFFSLVINSSLSMLKAITAFFGLLTLFVVYLIGKRFNIYYGIFSIFLLISIQMFSHFMMIAYVEIPIAFFSILLIYLFLTMNTIKKAIFTGMILALAYYTKTSALVFFLSLFLYALFRLFSVKDKKYFKLMFVAMIVSGLIILPLALRNLLLFNYPFIEGLNIFFKLPENIKFWPEWLSESFKMVSPVRPSLQIYISTFGWLVFGLSIFGITWLFYNWRDNQENKNLLLLLLLSFLIFLIIFNAVYFTGQLPLESRYLSIIFPQLAMLGGFFLWKMKEWNRRLLLLILPILFFSLFSGISTVLETSNIQRYPNDYIEALKWIKNNTPENSSIFTTYGGSLKYFGERDNIWASNMDEYFPEVMITSNSTRIYDILKQYNVSHILIWKNTIAQNYIIPESNLWGLFTYNFVNIIPTDTEHFENVFSNQNNWIFKVL